MIVSTAVILGLVLSLFIRPSENKTQTIYLHFCSNLPKVANNLTFYWYNTETQKIRNVFHAQSFFQQMFNLFPYVM